ncbi:rho-related GTP-binding protein RhoF-like isoform X1 [Acipenser ruthenus]|uniref:rho-related GTP-binding protein RhoF-like isoform X1 n=2 Tax=Acipenser ruthenus TaxID=7906 RepID=UPI00274280A6|nr:rho-related GTP-binding protein RhoF-like isoform X1 [Acipenser ruthenus]
MERSPRRVSVQQTGHAGPQHASAAGSVKTVIVGDGGCGKTSLLMVFVKGDFPEAYVPTVFDRYTASITVDNKQTEINLWDTAGQEDYDRLRPLSYTGANVVLICYDVTNPGSFDNVLTKWSPEVRHFCKGVPILLVGCKTDLRKDKIRLRKLRANGLEPITYSQGEHTAKQIRASMYLECSARFQENVADIFKEAVAAATSAAKKRKSKRRKKQGCAVS